MENSKCLVTGGAGFIGSNIVDELIKLNHKVIVIDNLSTGKKENVNKQAEFYKIDITNTELVETFIKAFKIDYVFHEAALPRIPLSIKNPILTNDVNIKGTLNILNASAKCGVKKVIYAASSSALGNCGIPMTEDMRAAPLNPYALQKYVGELYCKIFSNIYELPTVCLRYFNVYGPRQSEEGAYLPVIGIFMKQKKEGKPLTIAGDGEQTRDFTHVYDVVRANILAMESDVGGGEVINIGAGNNISINEIAAMIGGETTHYPLPRGEMPDTLADISKAKKMLGWEPEYDIKRGIESINTLNLKE